MIICNLTKPKFMENVSSLRPNFSLQGYRHFRSHTHMHTFLNNILLVSRDKVLLKLQQPRRHLSTGTVVVVSLEINFCSPL